ncbi:MAG: restriction endonuclease subunit S [Candidatus Electrothrix sp. AW1]|nr:restriction endonuclease subunit S [Candidatus Electrothrix sp. AX1]MCI5182999.1 restriction endonuclease subunit S [Candidatus Electrothrix gigas]
MKPYPKYKDSGVEWIGEVPEEWEVKKLKFFSKVIMGQSPNSADCNQNGTGMPFLQGNAEFSHKYPNAKNWCADPPKLTKKDDVLISVRAPIGALNIADQVYGIGRGLSAVRASNPIYLFYMLSTAKEKLLSLGTGSTFTAISSEQLGNMLLPEASSEEQTAIATFLDRKTAEIDKLIANKERLIKLYEEKKQAVINQAVTKGLDPDAEMRESGVEWLGEIPEHWEVLQLDYLIRVKARLGWKGLKASEYVPEGYGFLSTPNIKGAEIDYETINFISEDRYLESPEIMLQYNDVLLAKDGSTLGIVNIVKKLPFACTVNSSIAVLRVVRKEKILPDFLKYFMSCEAMQQVIERVKGGMGVPHLFQGDINKFKLLSPTIMEQTAIVHHIETQCSRIDAIINKLKKQINLFKEYRTALISEAVTGKIQIK